MDRRQFLTASGVAAALAHSDAQGATRETPPSLFKDVNFTSDGLGFTPREYATLLERITREQELAADYYSNGGAIAELEATFARLLGKEAAMFVPTGTLADHIAVRKLAGNDRRVLVQAESHLYNDSGDCAETLSALNLVPLGEGRSTLTLDEIVQWVERSAGGRVPAKVGVLSIESPVRRRDHDMVDFAELERVCRYAREQGIRLHLDGARLFNLPYHAGRGIEAYTALFDTVYVSLWKHFNAASGAILAGDAAFIDALFHTRRMFGGSLPQAWPVAIVASQHAEGYLAQYEQSWQAVDRLIALLQGESRLKFRKVVNGTSRFFLGATGVAAEHFVEQAASRGVRLPHANPVTGEFAMQVNPSVLRMPVERVAKVLRDALRG